MAGNSSQEAKLGIKRKRRNYQESVSTENTVCKASNRQRTYLESKVESLWRTNRGKLSENISDSDHFVGGNDMENIGNGTLETIVEEFEGDLDGTMLKRVGKDEGTGESFENDDAELRMEIKRPRTTLLKEEKQNINTDIREGDFMESLSDGSKTQSSSNALDIHEGKDKDIEATQSSTHTKQSLESVDNCLNGLNNSSCSDSSKCSELERIHAIDGLSDGRIASETADELFECNDYEKSLKNSGPREESEKDNNSDSEGGYISLLFFL